LTYIPKKTERRTCLTCGHIFQATAISDEKFCCATCRIHFNSDGKKKKSLEDWAAEARVCRMTYGKYRAAVERLGKTFEELQK